LHGAAAPGNTRRAAAAASGPGGATDAGRATATGAASVTATGVIRARTTGERDQREAQGEIREHWKTMRTAKPSTSDHHRPKNVISQLIAGRSWPLLLIRPLLGSHVEPLTYPHSVMPRTFA